MTSRIDRRGLLAGLGASSALMTAGCEYDDFTPALGGVFKAGEAASYQAQKLLLSQATMAREFSPEDISSTFPVVGKLPKGEDYHQLAADEYRNWRLPFTGLVERPRTFSLAELMEYPARTQITSHSCQEGWTAIGQWKGVQLSRILDVVGVKPQARFIFFHAYDGWYNSLHMFDAVHPQTILAWEMNGEPVPMPHGAPVRLRVERHLGYKSLKFLKSVLVTATLEEVGNGLGSSGSDYGYSWNAGI